VSFKNTVIIMTSNIGSQLILEMRGADERTYQRMREQVLDALRRQFRPEFLNRVDEVVVFRALTEAELAQIVEIQLEGLRRRLASGASPSRSRRRPGLLARVGYDPVFGARPLKRAIQREVETPVARLIVAGRLRENGGKTDARGRRRRCACASTRRGERAAGSDMRFLRDDVRWEVSVLLQAPGVPRARGPECARGASWSVTPQSAAGQLGAQR
jgi:ATP-dependent Clp protease ATP-binding subunit ClpA